MSGLTPVRVRRRQPEGDTSIRRFLGPDCDSLPVATKKATGFEEGDKATVAFRKAPLHLSRSGERKATLHLSLYQVRLPFIFYFPRFVSALLVWVRRRHPPRPNQRSDARYVAIRYAVCPYTCFLWLSIARACEESDEVAVATQKATGC
ncbi:hypothetical protein Taro_055988 [Colocasia esculenta]|uniref:Uncharacterized protein n=1 Tax=Colocasia esculenta TaxID=4460 RepID=A0A843XSS0_COLES|nr:hypothetical protein [Colocasia esculenta]